mmetsp:Transcript_41008/g.96361  ORF Transcript_41008/g.96361 Transcript_41008/m.96361 type:complete len:104 (+) Transcript_41008:90-401(+)
MLGQSAAPVLPPRSSHRCCVHAPVHNAMPLRASDAGCTGDGADAHATAISCARVQAGFARASDASSLREVSLAIPGTSSAVELSRTSQQSTSSWLADLRTIQV